MSQDYYAQQREREKREQAGWNSKGYQKGSIAKGIPLGKGARVSPYSGANSSKGIPVNTDSDLVSVLNTSTTQEPNTTPDTKEPEGSSASMTPPVGSDFTPDPTIGLDCSPNFSEGLDCSPNPHEGLEISSPIIGSDLNLNPIESLEFSTKSTEGSDIIPPITTEGEQKVETSQKKERKPRPKRL
jgi:hypothetical protein